MENIENPQKNSVENNADWEESKNLRETFYILDDRILKLQEAIKKGEDVESNQEKLREFESNLDEIEPRLHELADKLGIPEEYKRRSIKSIL